MLTLVNRSFQRVAVVFSVLAGVLVVFQLVSVIVAASFESSRSFERMVALVPAFVTRSFASSLLTLASFRAMAVAGYFHPVIVLVLTQFAIYLASEPAGDVELGFVDVVLARPLPRRELITRSLVLTMVATLTVILAMATATYAGLFAFAPGGAVWPAARTVLVLSVELLMVAWTFGSASLAAAAFARRRATPMTTIGVLAVALYLLEFLGSSWAPAAPFARVSPFHYYDGTAILVGRADLGADLVVLGTMILACTVLAYWQFGRRDL